VGVHGSAQSISSVHMSDGRTDGEQTPVVERSVGVPPPSPRGTVVSHSRRPIVAASLLLSALSRGRSTAGV